MTIRIAKVLFAALVFAAPISSWAHGHDHDSDETLAATLSLYQRIAELTPEVTGEKPLASSYVRIAGQNVWLNGAFWDLVRGWIRVYYSELKQDCPECVKWDEAQFTAAAEDQIARSFFAQKLATPIREGAEHISIGAADVGARFGSTALVAKITGEVAETILSKMSFMGGAHFFCHLIDAFIVFSARRIQTATRTFIWARAFDRSGIASVVRGAFLSTVARRAQNRVRFVAGPVTVNEEQIKEVDAEGPNRYWGWVKDGKRATWVREIVAQQEPTTVTVDRKEFLGTRMKRYLWLKSRKRGHRGFMKGSTSMDKKLNQDTLWILAVQENILQRSLLPASDEIPRDPEKLATTAAASADEIRRGLAYEFSPDEASRALFVENLMKDVEVVFNPDVPSRIRYFQATALENLIGGFMNETLNSVISEKGEAYGSSLSGIWAQIKLRWKTGKLARYIYQWTDFLRLASQQKDPAVLLRHKYESMEALLRILRYFGKTSVLLKAKQPGELDQVAALMDGEYSALMTFRPWAEKKVATSWWPWSRKAPSCLSLDRAVSP